MKKLFLLFLLLFTSGIGGLGAEITQSTLYAKTMLINKVFLHQKGYMVQYFKQDGKIHTVFIPIEWFSKSKTDYLTEDKFVKAEVLTGDGAAYPYITIFYDKGKFHHIRLFLRSEKLHPSWGLLTTDIEQYFDPKKDITFEY